MMLLMVGLLTCLGARLVCSYMKKSQLQTLLKLQTANRQMSCRISRQELPLTYEEKINKFSPINQEILFKTDNSGLWTFLSPIWNELTGFTVAESIGNSFLDYVHPSEYLRNLELFQILKARHIEESVYKTRYKTRYGDVCLVKIRIRTLVDSQGQMIGTSGRLELIDFEKQLEYYENDQHQEEIESDAEVIGERNQTYLEALINIESALHAFDASDEFYTKIMSILGVAYKASRVYIFENHKSQNGDLLTNQKAEWCNTAIPSQIDTNIKQNIPITEIFPHGSQILARGDVYWGYLRDLSVEEKKFLEARGIVSILLLPIIVKDEFLGFIGLDDCMEDRDWQSTKLKFLQATVGAISLAYENFLIEKKLSKSLKKYQNINFKLEEKVNQIKVEERN